MVQFRHMARKANRQTGGREGISNEDLARTVARGFASIDERFHRMDERFDKMDERFDKMDERFSYKFDGLSNRIDALASERATRGEVAVLTKRVERVERGVGLK